MSDTDTARSTETSAHVDPITVASFNLTDNAGALILADGQGDGDESVRELLTGTLQGHKEAWLDVHGREFAPGSVGIILFTSDLHPALLQAGLAAANDAFTSAFNGGIQEALTDARQRLADAQAAGEDIWTADDAATQNADGRGEVA